MSAQCFASPASHSALTRGFSSSPSLFTFCSAHPAELQDCLGNRNHVSVLYSEKEALLICTITILYFLITLHPFPSLTLPNILFAFLIRPVQRGDAFRELVVKVPRSFSWAESINLRLWELNEFFSCYVYNYSQFSLLRERKNEALKCKVTCANHHRRHRKLHLHAVTPGEAASYLCKKDRCLFCAELSTPRHQGSSSPQVPGDQRWPCQRRCVQ